ncbi:MAG: hypothetical protein H6813_07600 [Phycisphaeraceae bacterium]|nr:hypothetical protein [Phycisphaeraceae bacterium]MCB9848360.1 hypothetical protein [Phycisphaeraceae bacterium]
MRSRLARLVSCSTMLAGAVAMAVPVAARADDSSPALGGVDVVAFSDASTTAPVPGDASITAEYAGRVYWFASSEHAAAFTMTPEVYVPLFGGNDPALLAQGKTAPGDARWFTVIDGGLYFFSSENTRDLWLRSFDMLAPRALAGWNADAKTKDRSEAVIGVSLGRDIEKYLVKSDVGAGGYDVVSYFLEGGGKPLKGEQKIEVEYRGVTYQFASADNAARFRQRPSRYEPAYGGWCAYAIAHEGYTKPNPKRFLIQNDRLMLFYDGFLGDTYKSWNKEGAEKLEGLADRWWERETGEPTPGTAPGSN